MKIYSTYQLFYPDLVQKTIFNKVIYTGMNGVNNLLLLYKNPKNPNKPILAKNM